MQSFLQQRRLAAQLSSCPEEKQTNTLHQSRSDDHQNGEKLSTEVAKSTHKDGEPSNSRDDRFVVRKSSDDDPIDPRNWPLLARSKNILLLALLIFTQAWASASNSMANRYASQEFNISRTTENLATAAYLFGIASGALFAGPLSETFGRNPTYLVSTFCYLFFVLGSAVTPTFGGQVACRYLAGLFASPTLSINGSSVGDQFRPVKRAFVFPIIAWANVAAPVIAPICGGWVVGRGDLSWRWTEWITMIISGFAFLLALLFLPETYLPLLLDWKAKQLRRLSGDERYTSEHAQAESLRVRLRKMMPLPLKFLATEPVIGVLGGYLVLLYAVLFSFLSGFDYVFRETYRLSDRQTGACFASVAIGATAFTVGAPGLYSWARHETEHVRGASIEPEFRLWPAIVAAPLLPASLFWLGWTNGPDVSIWSGLGACFLFGIVLIAIYVSSYEYIIDSYGDHAAIALASITTVRYVVAGGIAMAARPMYQGLGVQWTMTLLGCLAALLAPAPLLFWWFGERLRLKSPYAWNGQENDGDGGD